MADTVQHGVEEDGAARGAAWAQGEGLEFDLDIPVVVCGFEQRAKDAQSAIVRLEELFQFGCGQVGVVAGRVVGEEVGVADLGGDDVA